MAECVGPLTLGIIKLSTRPSPRQDSNYPAGHQRDCGVCIRIISFSNDKFESFGLARKSWRLLEGLRTAEVSSGSQDKNVPGAQCGQPDEIDILQQQELMLSNPRRQFLVPYG